MKVAVLGAGATGCAAAVELTQAGHHVRLWNRSKGALEPILRDGAISHSGVLGDGQTRIEGASTELGDTLADCDLALVCLPAVAHQDLATRLANVGSTTPLVLSPGHVGGALHVRRVLVREGAPVPPIAELSTAPYVARRHGPSVNVTGRAQSVRAAPLGTAVAAFALAEQLFSSVSRSEDVLVTGLTNVNLVLHPPAAILASAWVEATDGAFRFYAEATTPGVARVMAALDGERRAVAAAFGHEVPSLLEEMSAIGTVDAAVSSGGDWRRAIARGEANSSIMAPDSLNHRYYREDFGFGVVPFVALAAVAKVEAPVATALLQLAATISEDDLFANARTAEALGIDGMTRDQVLELVHDA